ncbi:uroporphyrinogen decarboxylase family protein [Kamptonema cortianum]|nr:uroporphyrinogen decarboxylase family protein [Oscillatoria laete-virens]MDK3160229.1 uroporphyrinogen decarboxylase family protein [Kamptonema cortianum]MDL5048417.1 uroporphyrinogen decarboxylase family protein [Oscillatoria amoena NRMC-F 0135]MDL5055671.1 uroporphyrinogen decarboxylase family protein [Oscillatoria laete-virens NRMC-F 0139]
MNSAIDPVNQSVCMSNRDRIIKTLLCEPTDRPPLVSWLGWWAWGETMERWKKESGIKDLDVMKYFGVEPGWQVAALEMGPFPHFENIEISRDEEHVVSVDFRGIKMRNRIDGASMPEFMDYPVKSRKDWNRYKAERLIGPIAPRLAGMPAFLKHMNNVDAPVQLGNFPWGVFGTVRDIIGVEQFMYALGDDPEWIEDIMTTLTDLWLAIYAEAVKMVKVDMIHIWEDMAGKNGSLISGRMMERFMMPQYDRIHAFARAHEIPVICVDSDGKVDMIVDVITRHGVNAFFPFEVQAGNDIEEFGRKYPRLGLIGGLDKNALALDRAVMNQEIDKALRLFSRGGYLPGFDHLIPPNVPWDNFKYFMETLRKEMGL